MAKITRSPWLDTLANELVNVNNIISQGAVQVTSAGALQLTDGVVQNQIVHQTVDDLTDATMITSSSTTLTPQSLDSNNRKKVIFGLGKALRQAEYENIVQQQDQQSLIAAQIPEYALRQNQYHLIPVIQAPFKTGGVFESSHYVDATAISDGKLSDEIIMEAQVNALGENYDRFTIIAMHSKVFNQLRKKGLTDKIYGSELGAQVAFNGRIDTVAGLRVHINDTLCAPDTSGDVDVYPSYLMGNQSIALEITTDLYLTEEFSALRGMGTTDYAYYWRIAPYVRNMTWAGSNDGATSYADLGTATNWGLVDSKDKNVVLAKIDSVL